MYNAHALDIARTMLLEIRNNLDNQKNALGNQADFAYFEEEFNKLFKIQVSLNKLEV